MVYQDLWMVYQDLWMVYQDLNFLLFSITFKNNTICKMEITFIIWSQILKLPPRLSKASFQILSSKLLKKIIWRTRSRRVPIVVLNQFLDMSLVTRNPVFVVSDQVRLKPACSASETS